MAVLTLVLVPSDANRSFRSSVDRTEATLQAGSSGFDDTFSGYKSLQISIQVFVGLKFHRLPERVSHAHKTTIHADSHSPIKMPTSSEVSGTLYVTP